MKKFVNGLLIMFALMLVVSPAMATGVISVNLVAGGSPVGANPAGVVHVGNWNDYEGTSGVMALMDNSGAPTAATFEFLGGGTAWVTGAATGDPGNDAMLSGHNYTASAPLSGAFTGIPYVLYDLYVYYNSGAVTNTQTFNIQGTALSLDGFENPGADIALVDSQNGTVDGNYVLFQGLTASDVTVDALPVTVYTYMSGYQIVEVPEPMTIALMGLGGLALIRRKRA